MSFKRNRRAPALPSFLQRRHTDEFAPPPYTDSDLRAIAEVAEGGPVAARRLGVRLQDYWEGRHGTAAGLIALNTVAGDTYYEVPQSATLDRAAAESALGGEEFVFDVQTHFVAERGGVDRWNERITPMYQALSPDWWDLPQSAKFGMAEYLRCVFVESETHVAVLSSNPGLNKDRMLFDDEMAATRRLFERLGGTGRLLNHSVVHPEVDGQVDQMDEAAERFDPVGWKVYTLGQSGPEGFVPGTGWWLDDENVGVPFVEKAVKLDIPLVCIHKGISVMVDNGSPRDIGPVAKAFPDVNFVVYHSGYEFPTSDAPEEGPYTEETAGVGVNRLVDTVVKNGIAPGSNAFAELGTTWFGLIRRPEEAAHVLGKLLLYFGEDNVIWGTDAIWYGPSQVTVDAFRAFQIPPALRERYGYPELTPQIKAKVLGLNAARIYGIDPVAARENALKDDLAWVKAAIAEFERTGFQTDG